ncbi:MAG: hypothetical protein H7301_10370 [Cryobacterium sp.]|nr:hypothetical protein [Oligoflexia bacterium]
MPFTNAGPCPLDPDWDATKVSPGTPQTLWVQTSYDSAALIRHCRFNATCPAPSFAQVLPPPEGDGATPCCV